MRPISPDTGAPEQTFAEEQLEFLPLAVALYREEGSGELICLMRWTMTPEERAAVARGEDIFLKMRGGVMPHYVYVGKPEWA